MSSPKKRKKLVALRRILRSMTPSAPSVEPPAPSAPSVEPPAPSAPSVEPPAPKAEKKPLMKKESSKSKETKKPFTQKIKEKVNKAVKNDK